MPSVDPASVYCAVPTRGNVLSATVEQLDRLRDIHGFSRVQYMPGRLSVTDPRNRIVRDFLFSGKEWLWMVDDDVIPHSKVWQLFEHGKDIIGAPYFMVRPPTNVAIPCVLKWNEKLKAYSHWPKPFGRSGVEEIDAIGTGCIVIHRRVLEHPDLRPAFQLGVNALGVQVMTEDVLFCKKAKAVGFQVWVDWDVHADHLHSGISLNSIHMGYEALYAAAEEKKGDPLLWRPK